MKTSVYVVTVLVGARSVVAEALRAKEVEILAVDDQRPTTVRFLVDADRSASEVRKIVHDVVGWCHVEYEE